MGSENESSRPNYRNEQAARLNPDKAPKFESTLNSDRTPRPEPAKLEKMTVDRIEKIVKQREPIERILHPEEYQSKPEAALQLEQIEAAADRNVALEGLYERSH